MLATRFGAALLLGLSSTTGQELPTCAAARELVLPALEELRAETIPWHTTFREAVLEADRRQRPVLLWAMNGHPLGCT